MYMYICCFNRFVYVIADFVMYLNKKKRDCVVEEISPHGAGNFNTNNK